MGRSASLGPRSNSKVVWAEDEGIQTEGDGRCQLATRRRHPFHPNEGVAPLVAVSPASARHVPWLPGCSPSESSSTGSARKWDSATWACQVPADSSIGKATSVTSLWDGALQRTDPRPAGGTGGPVS